jgi:SM-20-related protein
LEKIFNTLIDSFIVNRIGIADNFLSESLSRNLKENLKTHYLKHQLKPAGIGESQNVAYDDSFRGDSIYWLDKKK